MFSSARHKLAGAFVLLMMGGTAGAQDASTPPPSAAPQTNSVGNPQLRDFELPGVRTTAPAQAQPQPAPPPVATPPSPTPSPTAAPEGRATAEQPAPRVTARPRQTQAAPKPPAEREAPPPAEAAATAQAPAEAPPATTRAPVLPVPPTQSFPAPQSAPRPSRSEPAVPWFYIGLVAAAAAAFLLFLFLKLRRRHRQDEEASVDIVAEPSAAPLADPLLARSGKVANVPAAPAAQPAIPDSIVSIQMRPWLELQFKPARAAATATEASVQFELTVINSGNAPAENVRIGMRMFSAGPGQEREIEAFYAEPFPDQVPIAVPALPPETAVKLDSAVALPKEQVREIEIQGQRLFVPTVAFNVVYEWGNGRKGQTSNSYLVGREAGTPSPKMGGFRLDLGPRLYRSVGQRPTTLAKAV